MRAPVSTTRRIPIHCSLIRCGSLCPCHESQPLSYSRGLADSFAAQLFQTLPPLLQVPCWLTGQHERPWARLRECQSGRVRTFSSFQGGYSIAGSAMGWLTAAERLLFGKECVY